MVPSIRLATSALTFVVVVVIVAACSSGEDSRSSSSSSEPMGPAGIYDIDPGCMLWSGGTYCDGQKYSNVMVCETQPSEACVESPSPTPSPNHTVYCCEQPCHRSGAQETEDGYCKSGREAYVCYEDQI